MNLDMEDFDRWLDGQAGPSSKPFMGAFVTIVMTVAAGLLMAWLLMGCAAVDQEIHRWAYCDAYDCGEDDGSTSDAE